MLIGNLSVEDIEDRLECEFSDSFRKFLKQSRQQYISDGIDSGKWHCFSNPFMIVCGDEKTCNRIKTNIDVDKELIQITYTGDDNFDRIY